MGGDGGVIATQRAYARGVGKNDEQRRDGKNIHDEQTSRASTCALSNEPFQEPLVACELGYIFNKEAVLLALMNRNLPDDFSHIRSLKDLKTLSFESTVSENGTQRRVCPITQDEFNGLHPFVVIWSTGKVLSEKAIREIGSEGLQEEFGPFSAGDVVRLLPLEQDMDAARAAMHRRRELRKSNNKKSKGVSGDVDREAGEQQRSKKRGADDVVTSNDGSNDKRTKANSSSQDNHPLSLTTSSSLVQRAVGSVEKNSEQSSVYKSLFHKDGEKDMKDRDLFMSVAGLRYTVS